MHDARAFTRSYEISGVYAIRLFRLQRRNIEERFILKTDKFFSSQNYRYIGSFGRLVVLGAYIMLTAAFENSILDVLPNRERDIARKRPGSRRPRKEMCVRR